MAPNASDQKHAEEKPDSELHDPMWSVVSFERREAGGLTYEDAMRIMSELDAAGVSGLCLLTDAAAARVSASKS